MQDLYGASTPELRRQKLMPFFWNVIAKKGQNVALTRHVTADNSQNVVGEFSLQSA